MQRMVIAVDVDGTLFDGTTVAPEAAAALRAAKAAGHVPIIVSGRRWETLPAVVPTVLDLFDRVVCEEGGVLVDGAAGDVRLLADAVDAELLAALVAAGVDGLDVGRVVVGAAVRHAPALAAVRDRLGSTRRLVVNKGSVALVPPGCDKASGLRAAIADLDVAHLPIIAIGDAENDLPMFAMATVAVAVANADEAVLAAGVELTHGVAGVGVAEAIRRHVPVHSSS